MKRMASRVCGPLVLGLGALETACAHKPVKDKNKIEPELCQSRAVIVPLQNEAMGPV